MVSDTILARGLALGSLALLACQSPAIPLATPTPSGSQGSGLVAAEQAAMGRDVFLQRCAKCHGQRGEGVTAPPLIGASVGLEHFGNAQNLLNFVKTYMPADAPGTLKESDYWAVLAFILRENGLYQGGSKPLGPDTAGGLSLKR